MIKSHKARKKANALPKSLSGPAGTFLHQKGLDSFYNVKIRKEKWIIYKITNHKTNQIYIGHSNKSLNAIFYEHIGSSLRNPKTNLHLSMKNHSVEHFSINKIETLVLLKKDVHILNEKINY